MSVNAKTLSEASREDGLKINTHEKIKHVHITSPEFRTESLYKSSDSVAKFKYSENYTHDCIKADYTVAYHSVHNS
jgi:hypothetical protein